MGNGYRMSAGLHALASAGRANGAKHRLKIRGGLTMFKEEQAHAGERPAET
jgi:hypothetical protein